MINVFSKDNMYNLICLEQLTLKAMLDIQLAFNNQLYILTKSIENQESIAKLDTPSESFIKSVNELTDSLIKSNANVSLVKNLIDELSKLSKLPINYKKKVFDDALESYNSNYVKNIPTVYQNTELIENSINNFATTYSIDLKSLDFQNENVIIPLDSITNTENVNSDFQFAENTLVISEKQKKVILPYKESKVKKIFLSNGEKYSSVRDVIDKLYTKPIKDYKFASIARFKEAYSLIMDKEHGSKKEALALAIELFFNYNLHPAIITACNSLDELDIYLACLETNSLDDFHFFNIKYEIPPALASTI